MLNWLLFLEWGGPVIISMDFQDRNPGLEVEDAPSLLLQNCNKEDPPCPCVHVERLCFEMDKKYTNTKLQLLLSPCVVIARDNLLVRHALTACTLNLKPAGGNILHSFQQMKPASGKYLHSFQEMLACRWKYFAVFLQFSICFSTNEASRWKYFAVFDR